MRFKVSFDKVQLFSYFILLSFTGTFLLQIPGAYISGQPVSFVDALFTAVSAVCVTGLSTVDMAVYTKTGFFIIMLLIELGGLGIISFIVMYLAMPSKKVSLVNRRVIREFFIDEVETNPRKILKNIILFMFTIEAIGVLALWLALRGRNIESPLFTSVFLSISAFCNAGFTPYSDNLAGFRDSAGVNTIVMCLIVSGGLGFIVMKNIYQTIIHKRHRLSLHTKIVLGMTISLIVVGALVVFLSTNTETFQSLSLSEKIFASLFQSVTARTAGFESIPQTEFAPIGKISTALLMFIGGSPGSIAGGIKTTTFFVLVLYTINGNARGKGVPLIDRRINMATTEKAIGILCKSLFIVFAFFIGVSITEGALLEAGTFTLFDLFFEVVSAFGTVGLSQALSPHLSEGGKLLIILTMFVGRTGVFAMALNMTSYTRARYVEYPDEHILVG
ncbi:MAG: potassium transporter [Spirochaetaceae bacterium]|jgi:trk system potassium uptake protein TrkH|nr:potassium transporter [Spirochaetaceae bacterium]